MPAHPTALAHLSSSGIPHPAKPPSPSDRRRGKEAPDFRPHPQRRRQQQLLPHFPNGGQHSDELRNRPRRARRHHQIHHLEPGLNILTTAAEDRKIRWWDLRSRHPVIEYAVDGPIGSCELNSLAARPNDPGILAAAAGKSVYLFDGITPGRILKKMDFRYDVASVAVNNETGRLVTGSANDTWARVYDLHTDEELGNPLPLLCLFIYYKMNQN